jgi:hypothetical protein
MTLLGLDLNATSVRAVHGPTGDYPLGLPLDPPGEVLPMVLSLEKHAPEVGRAGLRLLRNQPHLTCSNFLAHLGTDGAHTKRWKAGRHHLDSSQALAVVWQRLGLACASSSGVVLSLPAYLSRSQSHLIHALAGKHRVPVLGSLPSLLATALAGYAEQAWDSCVLVLDIDDHALSIGLVRAALGQAHLLETRHFPSLGLKVWQDRLINALADSCVLQSRRDPRDVPYAEQALFEQLDALLDASLHGRMIQLGVQATQWYQNLVVHPEQTNGFCAQLARQVAREVELFFQAPAAEEIPASVLLTAQAGRLPGLARLLQSSMEEIAQEATAPALKPCTTLLEDFGEGLIQDSNPIVSVALMASDAPARAAHGIGPFFQRGDVPYGHLELVAPLPLPQPVEAGPPRLHFQGQDFFLTDPSFTLGSQVGCHLIFDALRFPVVAPRHCEILFDHRTYLLHNRSHEGTLVNDNPVAGSTILHAGDWIRLGPDGPQVRFLGHAGGRHLTA